MTQEQFNERVLNLLEDMIGHIGYINNQVNVKEQGAMQSIRGDFYQLYHDSNRGKLHLTKK